MNEQNSDSLSFASLALALANDYTVLYVINSANDSYVEYSISGTEKELVKASEGKDFYADTRKNCRIQVWTDDQEYFLDAFKKENVIKALENGLSFSLTYRLNINGVPRYFFLKTIRSNDSDIVIGVRDIDVQKRKELKDAEASRTYLEIASSLASLFEVIYHVDMETGHFFVYNSGKSCSGFDFRKEGDNFFENTMADLQNVVHPDDRDYVMHEFKKEVLSQNISDSGSISITYRQICKDQIQYMNVLAFRQKKDSERVVIGVRNVTAQKKQEIKNRVYAHIAGALASRYEVIYYIDIDTDEYTIYSASEKYSELGTTIKGDDFFRDCVSDVKKYIHPDDADIILNHLQKEKLIESLRQKDSMSLTYRQLLDGRQQYMNMTLVTPENDPHHIIMGVSNIDADVRHELSIKAESQTFKDISIALAKRYEVIYHVNIITDEFYEYSASEKYSKLEIGARGKDFFRLTQENMTRDIYPEDLPMMSISMQKNNLIESLTKFGKTLLNYRLMIDGRAQYVSLYAVRPDEDSEHIIIAVSNVDDAKRMEIAYHNAVDMANKDALTGLKNKRAYVHAETELDELISNSENPAFAVVVCDLNGLKQINDTLGHKAGDEFIKKGCSIICNTFKHSPVFRIGGDEFAVILKGHDYENRYSLMGSLHDSLQTHRRNRMLILAAGISEFVPYKDMRVQDVFERADNLMYADKEICKAEMSVQ